MPPMSGRVASALHYVGAQTRLAVIADNQTELYNKPTLSTNYIIVIMNKKVYQEPTMMVVKLQHRENVLQASSEPKGRSSVENYNWNNEYEE